MPSGVYPRRKIASAQPVAVNMQVTIPEGGANVIVTAGKSRTIGTLYITRDGIAFRRAKAKTRPDRQLTWKNIQTIQKVGLLQ